METYMHHLDCGHVQPTACITEPCTFEGRGKAHLLLHRVNSHFIHWRPVVLDSLYAS